MRWVVILAHHIVSLPLRQWPYHNLFQKEGRIKWKDGRSIRLRQSLDSRIRNNNRIGIMVHTLANLNILTILHSLKRMKTPPRVHCKSHGNTSSASCENPRDINRRLDTIRKRGRYCLRTIQEKRWQSSDERALEESLRGILCGYHERSITRSGTLCCAGIPFSMSETLNAI